MAKRPDGSIVIVNEADIGKKHVESRQAPIEPDLLYPLLRGQDVQRWCVEPSLQIILAQNPEIRVGWDENWMKETLPKTYAYFKRFEEQLRQRSGYKKYFNPDTAPFYSMYNVGLYTMSAHKVVWREVSTDLRAGVVTVEAASKPIIPDHTLIAISTDEAEEAHYICALLNSSPSNFIVQGYVAMHPSPHVLKSISIPKFDPSDRTHQELASLSRKAHEAKAVGGLSRLEKIEKSIDEVAATIWGLTPEELKDIQNSLKDLGE